MITQKPTARRAAWAHRQWIHRVGFALTPCLFLLVGCTTIVNTNNWASSSTESTPPKGVYSVAQYGAKGDGVTDDGPAIQKAMSAAAAAGGGQVTFPCGEFQLLTVAGAAPSGRSLLYLSGVDGVQVLGQGSCSHVFTSLAQKSVFEVQGSTLIAFSKLRITALNVRYVETYGMDGGSAIRFTGVTNGSISNVEVDGASAGALYLTAGTSNVSVTNNLVHDTYGAGIWEDDCGGENAHNCLPSKPPANNIYDSNTLTNTTLAALSALDFDDGNGSSHAIVRNNTISWTRSPLAGNNEVQCIQINNTSDVSVMNNTCSGTPWNGIVITTGPSGYSKGVEISSNTIQNSGGGAIGGAGIVVYDDPAGAGVSGFTVSYNTISSTADNGITVYAASKPGNVHDGQILNNSVVLADLRVPGSSVGIDVEHSASMTVAANDISCNGTCIAAGVKVVDSAATTPAMSTNQVVNILGQALVIQ